MSFSSGARKGTEGVSPSVPSPMQVAPLPGGRLTLALTSDSVTVIGLERKTTLAFNLHRNH